jgi:hypothetical protein
MLRQVTFPLRTECPPGACVCERDRLLADAERDAGVDLRPLRLTRMEEQKLIERIEGIATFEELRRLQDRIRTNLGVELKIAPGPNEVRTVRGIVILLEDRPGLCKKVRQSIPAAVRKALDRHPEITWAILDANDLFGMQAGPQGA